MQRPTGVTIIGVVSIIGGILGICAAVAVLGLGTILGIGGAAATVADGSNAAVAGAGGLLVILSIVSLVLSVAQLAAGVGLLQLAPWAYRLTVIVTIASLVLSIITFVTGGGFPVVSIIVSAIVLWYMNQAEVKSAFGRPAGMQVWEGLLSDKR